MSVSALDRAKLLLKTSAKLAAVAAPLAVASQASASATGWYMTSSNVYGPGFSGGQISYPTAAYNFNYAQISNTGLKISGQFGPVSQAGSSGDAFQFLGNTTEVVFFGFMSEPYSAGQVIDTDIAVRFETSGGSIQVLDASTRFNLSGSGGGFVTGGQNYGGASPGSGGVFNASYFTDPLPTSGFGGSWEFRLRFNWTGQSFFDTLNLVVPGNSVDLNLTTPTPGAAGVMGLGGLVAMRRRRK